MKDTKSKTSKDTRKEKKSPKDSPTDSEKDDYVESSENEIDEFSDAEQKDFSKEELAKLREEFNKEAMPHMKLLHNYAYRMTNNQLDADDLVQETYLRAFRFFHKFERGTNCKAWLFRIMKNLYINNYRKAQKEPGKVDYEEVENFFDSIRSEKIDSNDLQQRVFSNLLDDELMMALNSLQDDFKTVVILCDLEGLSYEEIAEFLNCPVGTVRSRLHRGRKLLQMKLMDYARKKGYDVESNLM